MAVLKQNVSLFLKICKEKRDTKKFMPAINGISKSNQNYTKISNRKTNKHNIINKMYH